MATAYKESQDDLSPNYMRLGFISSFVGHAAIFIIIFAKLSANLGDFTQPIVYSVSLDGGKELGGRSQVSQTKDPTPIAPPKNVSSTAKQLEAQKEKPVPEVPAEDAEVSLADKAKVKITPTAKPTPTVSEKKKKEEQKKEPLKKDAKTKPTPKAAPVADPNKDYQKAMQRYLGESAEAKGKGFGAATVGGKGMGGGVQRSPEFIAYYNLLRSHIKEGWRWYDTSVALVARVYFRIERDGAIRDVRIIKSSGSREYDDSVLRALAKADPAPAPPDKEYQSFKEVTMAFDPRE